VAVGVEPRRELPRAAWASARRRWRAEKILEALQEDPPPRAFKVVAMTDAEISTTKGDIPDWRVAGLGNIGGLACVTSMWINLRHSATRATLDRRTADLVIHELGHTLGLPHCETPRCVMRDAKGRYLETADSSSGDFCEQCKASLPADLLRR
jgi:archaemetzincin